MPSANSAKMVSYGLAYGMEAYGLGQRLGVPVEEAAVDHRRATSPPFPLCAHYMDQTVAEATSQGLHGTLFGRMRPLARPALDQLPACARRRSARP